MTPAPAPASWRLDRRRREGGAWDEVTRAADPAVIRDEAAAPHGAELVRGDLLRALDVETGATEVWVVTGGGVAAVGPPPWALNARGRGWVSGWESDTALASEMLRVAASVCPRGAALAALALADDAVRAALHPLDAAQPAAALADARAWALGLGPRSDTRLAVPGHAEMPVQPLYAYYAAVAALEAADAAAALEEASAAGPADRAALLVRAANSCGEAGEYAAYVRTMGAGRPGFEDAERQLGAEVRRVLPLPELLLALAGDPPPLGGPSAG